MSFSGIDIDKIFLFDYIKENKLDSDNAKAIANMYKCYTYVDDMKKHNMLEDKTLMDYENEIYTIKGSKLTEKERIEVEFNRIERLLLDSSELADDVDLDKLKEDVTLLKNIFLDYYNEEDNDIVYYIKKRISLIQAKLDLDNYFLSAAYDMFYDLYFDIYCDNFELEKNL